MAEVEPNDPNLQAADDHLNRLLCADIEDPWYHTFVRNFKEFFNPPKLPPLEVTSKPVPVKDIWGLYGRQKKSFMMSTGLQACVVLLVLILTASKTVRQAVQKNGVDLRGRYCTARSEDEAPTEDFARWRWWW
jgi:hypothetical protein